MLTVEKLMKLEPGIFATGTARNSPDDVYMTNEFPDRELRWVAVRGEVHDWAIYVHWSEESADWVKSWGDKVRTPSYIRSLVLCDDEAFKMYRF